MLTNWEWQDTWHSIGILVVLLAISFLGLIALNPHHVDSYYISGARDDSPSTTCVYAHWTWQTDEKAYCSDDKDKILDFANKANATLPHSAHQ